MNGRQIGICIAVVGTLVGGQLAAPRRALADTTVNPNLVSQISNADISKWISLFDNYYDVIAHSASIAEFLNQLFNGGGADITTQIKDIVVAELNAENDTTWANQVDSINTGLREIAQSPNADDVSDRLTMLNQEALDIATAIENRVNQPPPDNVPSLQELIRIAPIYNAAMLQHISCLKIQGYSQDSINDRLRDELQTDFNLVGSGATWCDADGSTPISLWVGSQLYAALGSNGYNMLCSQPTTDLHLEVGGNPDDLVYQQIFPACQLARGTWMYCQNDDTDLSCPDTQVWGDYFASENCPSQLANLVPQCESATYGSTWNAFYNTPAVAVVWEALSDTEEALSTGSQSLAYVSAPGFCAGNLYLNDSD